jgi:hypothetical protein
MTRKDLGRIDELVSRLEKLERRAPGPGEDPIFQVARTAILDEITRLSRSDWLLPYRSTNLAVAEVAFA